MPNIMLKMLPHNSHCRTACVKHVVESFRPGSIAIHGTIENTLLTIQHFKKLQLEVKIFLPVSALILPFSWRVLFLYWKDVLFSRVKLELFASRFEKAAYVYHLTPLQLYGFPESWTHCVSEVFSNGEREFFDNLPPEDREICSKTEWPPNHKTLLGKWGMVICVGDCKKV